jgi:hypothetical protein
VEVDAGRCPRAQSRIVAPDLKATPDVEFWRPVPPPSAYESASRERMRHADNAAWADRSHDPKPVEGPSEIDITLNDDCTLIYIEAKLGADVSVRTTYDPTPPHQLG